VRERERRRVRASEREGEKEEEKEFIRNDTSITGGPGRRRVWKARHAGHAGPGCARPSAWYCWDGERRARGEDAGSGCWLR